MEFDLCPLCTRLRWTSCCCNPTHLNQTKIKDSRTSIVQGQHPSNSHLASVAITQRPNDLPHQTAAFNPATQQPSADATCGCVTKSKNAALCIPLPTKKCAWSAVPCHLGVLNVFRRKAQLDFVCYASRRSSKVSRCCTPQNDKNKMK